MGTVLETERYEREGSAAPDHRPSRPERDEMQWTVVEHSRVSRGLLGSGERPDVKRAGSEGGHLVRRQSGAFFLCDHDLECLDHVHDGKHTVQDICQASLVVVNEKDDAKL